MCFGGRGARVFGVGGQPEPDDAVPGFEVIQFAGPGGHDGTFSFAAEDFGFGGRVEAGAKIAVILC